ncbi:MAG: AzlD domain-containing protein [Ferrovibrionaceae bacterium]
MSAAGLPWLALLLAVAATYFWRGLGVALARRMKAEGALIDWVGCVAYALLAGLIARMIILPVGPIADIPLTQRGIAVACGITAYFISRKNILVGVLTGTATVALLVTFQQG